MGGGDDGFLYWEQALNVLHGREWIKTSIYPYLLGVLLKITNIVDPFVIRMFNLIGFILLVLNLIRLLNLQIRYKKSIRKRSEKQFFSVNVLLVILFFYLSLIMNVNLSIYRDVWIFLFYTLSTYFGIEFIFSNGSKYKSGLALIFSIYLTSQFRNYASLAFMVGIILFWLNNYILKNKTAFYLTILVLFGIYYTIFIDIQVPLVNMSLREALEFRFIGQTYLGGGSQMGINLSDSNYLVFLLNYIHSFIGNLIGPLPWHISGVSTLLVFLVETIPMFIILVYIVINRKKLSKVNIFILNQAIIWMAFISISNDNLGTATRLRGVAWLLVFIVFCDLLAENRKYQTELR